MAATRMYVVHLHHDDALAMLSCSSAPERGRKNLGAHTVNVIDLGGKCDPAKFHMRLDRMEFHFNVRSNTGVVSLFRGGKWPEYGVELTGWLARNCASVSAL